MKNIFLLVCMAYFFAGCIDINLKSELPKLKYFDLDNSKYTTTSSCEAYNFIALGNIDIPSEYKNNKILYKSKGIVSFDNNTRFIKPLDESLENIIIKEFNHKCIKTIIPPFSGINIEEYLKIKVIEFSIDMDNKEADVAIFYQINSKGIVLQSGILDSKIHFATDTLVSHISALKEASFNVVGKLADRIIPK